MILVVGQNLSPGLPLIQVIYLKDTSLVNLPPRLLVPMGFGTISILGLGQTLSLSRVKHLFSALFVIMTLLLFLMP